MKFDITIKTNASMTYERVEAKSEGEAIKKAWEMHAEEAPSAEWDIDENDVEPYCEECDEVDCECADEGAEFGLADIIRHAVTDEMR